jgi:hypothetical protein
MWLAQAAGAAAALASGIEFFGAKGANRRDYLIDFSNQAADAKTPDERAVHVNGDVLEFNRDITRVDGLLGRR